MKDNNSNTITVLDVGSAKTVALICQATDSGLEYRGHGEVESRGSRKGIIVELEKAVAIEPDNGTIRGQLEQLSSLPHAPLPQSGGQPPQSPAQFEQVSSLLHVPSPQLTGQAPQSSAHVAQFSSKSQTALPQRATTHDAC